MLCDDESDISQNVPLLSDQEADASEIGASETAASEILSTLCDDGAEVTEMCHI